MIKTTIKLCIKEPSGIDHIALPVTQGIPFPDKELKRNTPVRVIDSKGNILPVQSKCLATWDKDMEYVKWLLLDFQIDLKANESTNIFLEYGDNVESISPVQSVTVEEKNKLITISTGVLKLELEDGISDFFKSCKIKTKNGWQEMFECKPGPFLYMIDQNNCWYDSYRSGICSSVIVEERGPMRASVCIKGFHTSQNGLRFCPFILRIHLYAGKTDLRFYHTFVFDQNPDKIELSAIGMKFPLDIGDDLKITFDGENEPHFVKQYKESLFLQTSDIEYKITVDNKLLGNGSQTHGWINLSGNKGSAVVILRDMWKEYPKGIFLNKDEIDIQIWPKDYKKNLVFWTPFKEDAILFRGILNNRDEEAVKKIVEENPTAPLNLKSFSIQNEEELIWVEAMIEKYCQNRVVSYNDTGTSDGTGAAKTTEFVLRLSSKVISYDESEVFAHQINEPIIAPAEPLYTCSTGVIGPFYHKGDPRFSEIDKGLDDILELFVIEPRELCHLYGMMRYGNMVCSHSPAPGVAYRYYYKKDPSKALRYVGPYNNEANDHVYSVWSNFVRTGERKHFLLASAYSQNVADVCICHAHPIDQYAIGLMHYHSGHQWIGTLSPSHTLISGILLHYYFTGNRRLLEVALEVADWAVKWQEPCGIISNRYGTLSREFTGPLWCVIEAYKATWEAKYEDLARRSLNWFLKTQSKPGTFPISVYTRGKRGNEAWVEPTDEPAIHQAAGGIYQIFRDGMKFFSSELLRKTIIAEADYIIWNTSTHSYFTEDMAKKMLTSRSKLWKINDKWYWTQWGGPSTTVIFNYVVCLAYEITKNPIYVVYLKYLIDVWFPDMVERIRNFCPCTFTSIGFAAPISVMIATVVKALEKDAKAVERAEEEWRQKREKLGYPIYDGPYPGIPIDQKHFDANMNVISMSSVELELKAPEPLPDARSIGILECD